VQAYAAEHPYHVIESSASNYSKVLCVSCCMHIVCHSLPVLLCQASHVQSLLHIFSFRTPFCPSSHPGGLPAEFLRPPQRCCDPRAGGHPGAQVPAGCDRRVPGTRPGECVQVARVCVRCVSVCVCFQYYGVSGWLIHYLFPSENAREFL